VIRRNASSTTPYYLLAALDHRIDDLGELAPATPDQSIYLDIFARTFWMGAVITVICLLLAYPLAYLLANLPTRKSNQLMILVLLPFWTSILVRVAAWIVLLQSGGLINGALLKLGLIDQPLQLANTRTATVIGFVHFFIMLLTLTIYANFRQLSPSYRKAAADLGAGGLQTFLYVVLPLTLPGIMVGAFLAFVLAIGDYVTPQLLGGSNELLMPQLIIQQIGRRADLPLAAALSLILMVVISIAYLACARWLKLERT